MSECDYIFRLHSRASPVTHLAWNLYFILHERVGAYPEETRNAEYQPQRRQFLSRFNFAEVAVCPITQPLGHLHQCESMPDPEVS